MTDSDRRRRVLAAIFIVLGSLAMAPAGANGETARTIGPTPPRLAFVDGEVSFWRPGAEDWTPAHINMALAAGDTLYNGEKAHCELALGRRAFVRAAGNTKLDVASLETGYLQFEVTAGHVALDLRGLPAGERLEVDTPQGAVTIDRAGYYRVGVHGAGDRTIVTTRRGGPATVIPLGSSSETAVAVNEQAVLEGTEVASVRTLSAPGADAFDRWNRERTTQLDGRSRHERYVSSAVAGVDDLDAAGTWRETRHYGPVWVPHDVAAGWAPYTTGRWVWDVYYGWTWVDDAPWGWAPYHYGRWVWIDDAWGWAPGPIVSVPVYAPALVAFFGPVGVSVDVRIGFPFVSWVALGFGEPVLPWWGPAGFVGRPFWCGWGGPRLVDNVVINNTTIVNAGSVTTFQNLGVHNAVAAVPRDQFGRGAVQAMRLTSAQVRQLRPVRGQPGVRPTATSLVAVNGHAQRPPEWMQHRQVAATRVPQSSARALRSAGLAAGTQGKAAPVHLVHATRHSGAATLSSHAPSRPHAVGHTLSARSHNLGRAASPSHVGHAAPSRQFGHPRSARSFAGHPRVGGHAMMSPRASFHPSRPSFQPHGGFRPSHSAMSRHGAPAGHGGPRHR